MAVVALADYLPRLDVTRSATAPVAEPEPGPDLIAAAEERGRNEANAAAEARIAAMLNDEQAAARAGLEEARRAWTSEQADRLAARIAGGLDEIERGLGGAITRVLTPFLATAARDRAIAELGSIVSGLLRDGANPVIRISGPEDLLAAVEGRLGDAGATVSFVPGDSAEVEVVADRTLVATRIGAWMDRLWQAEEGTYG